MESNVHAVRLSRFGPAVLPKQFDAQAVGIWEHERGHGHHAVIGEHFNRGLVDEDMQPDLPILSCQGSGQVLGKAGVEPGVLGVHAVEKQGGRPRVIPYAHPIVAVDGGRDAKPRPGVGDDKGRVDFISVAGRFEFGKRGDSSSLPVFSIWTGAWRNPSNAGTGRWTMCSPPAYDCKPISRGSANSPWPPNVGTSLAYSQLPSQPMVTTRFSTLS